MAPAMPSHSLPGASSTPTPTPTPAMTNTFFIPSPTLTTSPLPSETPSGPAFTHTNPNAKLWGMSIAIILTLFFIISLLISLFFRGVPLGKYLKTSINPLVLIITWPYHLSSFLTWICCKTDKNAEKDARKLEEGVEWEMLERPQRIGSGHAYEARSMRPIAKVEGQWEENQVLDLGLPNQIHMNVSKQDVDGRTFISVEDLTPPVRPATPSTVHANDSVPAASYIPTAHYLRTSPPHNSSPFRPPPAPSACSMPTHSPYVSQGTAGGRSLVGGGNSAYLGFGNPAPSRISSGVPRDGGKLAADILKEDVGKGKAVEGPMDGFEDVALDGPTN